MFNRAISSSFVKRIVNSPISRSIYSTNERSMFSKALINPSLRSEFLDLQSQQHRLMSNNRGKKKHRNTIATTGKNIVLENLLKTQSNTLSKDYDIGTLILYKSKYPNMFRYFFAILAFILVSHYMMVPELAQNNTMYLGTAGWVVLAGLETLILAGTFALFANRYVRTISCSITNPRVLPDHIHVTVCDILGRPKQRSVMTSHFRGLTIHSRATAANDKLLHVRVDGPTSSNENLMLTREGYYYPDYEILNMLLGDGMEDIALNIEEKQ